MRFPPPSTEEKREWEDLFKRRCRRSWRARARWGPSTSAAGPGAVGHPEITHHGGLAGIVLFEDLAVEKALLGEGLRVGVLPALFLELGVGVPALAYSLRSSTMEGPTGVRKGRLLPPEQVVRQPAVALKGVAAAGICRCRAGSFSAPGPGPITYLTKKMSPKGTRASRLFTLIQRSARSTSYMCISSMRFLLSA